MFGSGCSRVVSWVSASFRWKWIKDGKMQRNSSKVLGGMVI